MTFTTLFAKAGALFNWRWLALVALCLGLTGCAEDGSVKWRQKTTIVVETPSGVKTGSSVVEVDWFAGYALFTDSMKGAKGRLRGEAVVVDLGSGKYLFGLLKGDFGSVMGTSKRLADRLLSVKQAVAAVRERGTVTLPRDLYPMLVRFEDIDDPKTVKQVPPAGFGDYRIKEITFEITDEPVTAGPVEKVLGWLGEHPEPKLGPASGGTTNIPFYRRVTHGEFIRRQK